MLRRAKEERCVRVRTPASAEYASRMSQNAGTSEVIFLPPGSGRSYQAGPIQAVFKADGAETDDAYASRNGGWSPATRARARHSHEENVEIFYVIEGTMSFLVDEDWLDVPRGSFLRIPAGVTHDFENRSPSRRARSTCSCLEASRRRCRQSSTGSP